MPPCLVRQPAGTASSLVEAVTLALQRFDFYVTRRGGPPGCDKTLFIACLNGGLTGLPEPGRTVDSCTA